MSKLLAIEVVCISPDTQFVVALKVPAGITIREALQLSLWSKAFPALDISKVPVGIFGQLVSDAYVVQEGDRVEVYRPLQKDPKQARRWRAKRGAN